MQFNLSKLPQSPTHYDKVSARDKGDKTQEPPGLREGDLEAKVVSAYRSITDLYNELKNCTIDEISRSMGVDPVSIFEKERDKKPDLDTLINGLKYFQNRMLKYHVAVKEISEKKRDRTTLAFGQEELLPIVEADLKASLREQEKLRLLLETAHLKIKNLEKKHEDAQNQLKKISSETHTEKSRLKTQLKSQTEQLKLLQEENIVIKRPTTTGGSSSVKKIREIRSFKDNYVLKDPPVERDSFNMASPAKSGSAQGQEKDSVKMISMQMEQNKLHNLQKKQELKEFRRKEEQEREKELTIKQKDVLIARLNIQVEERDKDIIRLKNDYEKIFQELKKMKEREGEREKEEWAREVLSEKNPAFINFEKKKQEKKDEEISKLRKQVRKYALGEKKVFIKEKAFELERADYQDKLVYLQDRVNKLGRINDDLKKYKEDGVSKDRFRKKRETNLNKSQTSSDDNNETKGGIGMDTVGTMGTIADSYGKTPKVGFDKVASGRANKLYFH